jgi:hypothetical protein
LDTLEERVQCLENGQAVFDQLLGPKRIQGFTTYRQAKVAAIAKVGWDGRPIERKVYWLSRIGHALGLGIYIAVWEVWRGSSWVTNLLVGSMLDPSLSARIQVLPEAIKCDCRVYLEDNHRGTRTMTYAPATGCSVTVSCLLYCKGS